VSGDNARQETRQKIHVVNGHSISLGHAEVKSPNREAKSSLGGLTIELAWRDFGKRFCHWFWPVG
jgi:hypothetical protein